MKTETLQNLINVLTQQRSGFGDEPLANMLGEECAQPHLTQPPPAEELTPSERHAIELEERARWPEYLAAAGLLAFMVSIYFGWFPQ